MRVPVILLIPGIPLAASEHPILDTGLAYLIFNSIGNDPDRNGQWITELDSTYLHMTNRSTQIVAAAVGSEAGWLEGSILTRSLNPSPNPN